MVARHECGTRQRTVVEDVDPGKHTSQTGEGVTWLKMAPVDVDLTLRNHHRDEQLIVTM